MVFLWKLDATKNCFNYGITIWCIKLTEFRPFDFHYSRAMVLNSYTGLEIATDTVANATNIFSLATKNSGLVAKVATRFLYILDFN